MLFRKASIYFSLCFSFSLLDILIMVSSCHWYAIMAEWKSKYLARLLSCNYLTLLGSGSKKLLHILSALTYSRLWRISWKYIMIRTNKWFNTAVIYPTNLFKVWVNMLLFLKNKSKINSYIFLILHFSIEINFPKKLMHRYSRSRSVSQLIYFCIKKTMKRPF